MAPVNFVDEGVEPLLDMLADRFGINALMIGTVSWLGLKVGRRVSHELEGWPDHGRRRRRRRFAADRTSPRGRSSTRVR